MTGSTPLAERRATGAGPGAGHGAGGKSGPGDAAGAPASREAEAAPRSDAAGALAGAGQDRAIGRTLRWLLGAQLAVAGLLILVDAAPRLPDLLRRSDSPALDQPTRPGDQTRRYTPRNPAQPGPGIDPDMPRRLDARVIAEGETTRVALRGAIAPGDAERVVPLLRENAPGRVTLDSPGGSVRDALAIGRALRALAAETVLEDAAICLSACPYVFAGGTVRRVAETARLGVHQHSFGENTVLPAFIAIEDIQRGQAEVVAHLSAMGVDLRLMEPALATPANEIYILSRDELTEWRVITE